MIVGGLIGLLLGVLLIGWIGYERQRALYEQIFSLLQGQRDEARREMKVFRGLLFPAVAKFEGVFPPPPTEQPANQIGQPAGSSQPARSKLHIPFKTKFKQALRSMNTPQIARDRLAAALEKQPSGEKANV